MAKKAALAPAHTIPVAKLSGVKKKMAAIYNEYGFRLEQKAKELGIGVESAAAVLKVESGGKPFSEVKGEQREIIRFENHIFFDQYTNKGKDKARVATFKKHFHMGTGKNRWKEHKWRRSENDAWQEFHGKQVTEYEVLEFAATLDGNSAYNSISMGLGQQMGFNAKSLGYKSSQAMFEAFKDEGDQVDAVFAFVKSRPAALKALKNKDYTGFATVYNGTGQAAAYGANIQEAAAAYKDVTKDQAPAQPSAVDSPDEAPLLIPPKLLQNNLSDDIVKKYSLLPLQGSSPMLQGGTLPLAGQIIARGAACERPPSTPPTGLVAQIAAAYDSANSGFAETEFGFITQHAPRRSDIYRNLMYQMGGEYIGHVHRVYSLEAKLTGLASLGILIAAGIAAPFNPPLSAGLVTASATIGLLGAVLGIGSGVTGDEYAAYLATQSMAGYPSKEKALAQLKDANTDELSAAIDLALSVIGDLGGGAKDSKEAIKHLQDASKMERLIAFGTQFSKNATSWGLAATWIGAAKGAAEAMAFAGEIIHGAADLAHNVAASAGKLATRAGHGIMEGAHAAAGWTKDTASAAWSGTKNLASAAWNWTKGAASTAGHWMGEKADAAMAFGQGLAAKYGPQSYADDGGLTGPFYPKAYSGEHFRGAEDAAAHSGQVALFINGVKTDLPRHQRAAQELAEQIGKPVVGIYNATGGTARDLLQCITDKIGVGGLGKMNPATNTLTRLIKAYGSPKADKGGLDIYAHSQGSIIVSEALREARGDGADIRGVDVTTFGNAAATMPKGLRGYHNYTYDDDVISTAAGSNSIFARSSMLQSAYSMFGMKSTAQDSFSLHHGGALDRPHGLVPDEVIGKDGKPELDPAGKPIYDSQRYYIGDLQKFRAKEAAVRSRDKALGPMSAPVHALEDAASPARSLTSTAFAFGRAGATKGAGLVGAGYGAMDHGLRAAGGGAVGGISGGYERMDAGLRGMGRKISPYLGPMGRMGGLAYEAADASVRSAGRAGAGVAGGAYDLLDGGVRMAGRGLLGIGNAIGAGYDAMFGGWNRVQRSGVNGSGDHPDVDADSLRSRLLKQSAGSPVDSNVREKLSGHLGFDPSGARIHTGPAAAAAARDLKAEAFTIGRDVFFGAGMHDPASAKGLGLMAHELTHVGQQTGTIGEKARFFSQSGGDEMEQEAQQTAERVLANAGTRGGLFVENYIRHYETEDDQHLSHKDQERLDRISVMALGEAEKLMNRGTGVRGPALDHVQIDVDIDLSSASDTEAAMTWARAIVSSAYLEAGTLSSHAADQETTRVQRRNTDDAPGERESNKSGPPARRPAADELIAHYRHYLILDDEALGDELLSRVRTGQDALVTQVFYTLGSSNRSDVAYAFMKALPIGSHDAELKRLLQHKTVGPLIDRIAFYLTVGGGSGLQEQANRILTARAMGAELKPEAKYGDVMSDISGKVKELKRDPVAEANEKQKATTFRIKTVTPNPMPADMVTYVQYTLEGISPFARSYQWTMILPPALKRNPFDPLIPGWYLLGPNSYRITIPNPFVTWFNTDSGIYTIFCQQKDAHGTILGTAVYYHRKDDPTEQRKKESAIDSLQSFEKKATRITEGFDKLIGLRAIHHDVASATDQPLKIFIAKGRAGEEPYSLLDLTFEAEVEGRKFDGATIGEAVVKYKKTAEGRYPRGYLRLELEKEQDGIKPFNWGFPTTGATSKQVWSRRLGTTSLATGAAALALGVGAIFIPVLAIPATALGSASLGTGITSSGLSLYDELEKEKMSGAQIALDVVGLAGAFAGTLKMMRPLLVEAGEVPTGVRKLLGLAHGSKVLTYVELGSGATQFIGMSAKSAHELQVLIDNKEKLPPHVVQERINALLLDWALAGGMFAVSVAGGAKDLKGPKAGRFKEPHIVDEPGVSHPESVVDGRESLPAQEETAKAPGTQNVRVNEKRNVYHTEDSPQFDKIKTFKTMTEAEAQAAGNRKAHAGAKKPTKSTTSAGAKNATFEYNMVENPGPLAEKYGLESHSNPALNFQSGKYNVIKLKRDLVLYRAGEAGGGKKGFGQWFTREPAASEAQARNMVAVKSQWIDQGSGGKAPGTLTGTSPIESVYAVRIPKGTTIYEGPAGYQEGIYQGGADQIFVPKPWEIDGAQVVSETPIKDVYKTFGGKTILNTGKDLPGGSATGRPKAPKAPKGGLESGDAAPNALRKLAPDATQEQLTRLQSLIDEFKLDPKKPALKKLIKRHGTDVDGALDNIEEFGRSRGRQSPEHQAPQASPEEISEGYEILNHPSEKSRGGTATHEQILRANMKRAGRPVPAGHEAHHVVPKSDEGGKRARQVLARAGIDIDSEVNGVALRRGADVPIDATIPRHEHIHSKTYYKALTDRLQAAERTGQVESEMTKIRDEIEGGSFPF